MCSHSLLHIQPKRLVQSSWHRSFSPSWLRSYICPILLSEKDSDRLDGGERGPDPAFSTVSAANAGGWSSLRRGGRNSEPLYVDTDHFSTICWRMLPD